MIIPETRKEVLKMNVFNIRDYGAVFADTLQTEKIQKAIEEGNLSEAHLQKITGHRLPIEVNFNERSIHFINF